MKISLIIATRNRCQQLQRCLGYLKRLQCKYEWELITVNNGSSDDTVTILEEFARRVNFHVTIVEEPRKGLGRAHNTGIASARGEILAFTDDDCYPDPSYLAEMIRVFQDPEVGYMGGASLTVRPI